MMTTTLPRQHAFADVLRRALSWPARVGHARRTMTQLARMSEHELRDIGLSRQDVSDATALRIDEDPTALLVRRRAGRERPSSHRADIAA